jgi:hypothetical protein
MPTYEGTVARITSPLQQAVEARIHNAPLRLAPVAHGSVRARFHTPLGDFGKTASIDGGAFKVTVAEVGELRYRLLVRADAGQTFFGVPIPIPVFRSLDLPAGSSANLQIAFRILTAQDLHWLKSEFGVTVPATIGYELFRAAVGQEPNLQNVRAKEEGGRLRIDFEYAMTGLNPNGKILLEASPSTSYALERIVNLTLKDLELFGLASLAAPFVEDRVEDAVANANLQLAEQFEAALKRLPAGITMTLTRASAEDDGFRITAAIGLLL